MSDVLEKIIGFVDDAMVERGYRKCIDAANGDVMIIEALELERKGGPCHYCGVPYKRIDVNNRYGRFSYYQPFCFCYRRCPCCDKILVVEKYLGIESCTVCYPNGSAKKKKDESKHKKLDGKSAAAGDKESD